MKLGMEGWNHKRDLEKKKKRKKKKERKSNMYFTRKIKLQGNVHNPCGVMAKVLNCVHKVSEIKLQLLYHIHF